MIRVRTDDILVTSEPMKGREFQKFVKHHMWVLAAPELFYHTPNILVRPVQQFPECVDYLVNEQKEGRLRCDLHGLVHDPMDSKGNQGYSFLAVKEIEQHLEECFDWFDKTFDEVPIRWCTPHGSNSPMMQEAANKFDLIIEGVDYPVIDQKVAEPLVRKHKSIKPLEDRVIMVHYWERGLRLFRIVQVAKHGSWEAAKKVYPDYF